MNDCISAFLTSIPGEIGAVESVKAASDVVSRDTAINPTV